VSIVTLAAQCDEELAPADGATVGAHGVEFGVGSDKTRAKCMGSL
jgi:hypothetical protein